MNRGARLFIMSGINTGTEVIAGVLGVIPELDGVETADEALEIARNSKPLVTKLALNHLGITVPMLDQLRNSESLRKYKPGFFEVKSSKSGPFLDTNTHFKEIMKKEEELVKSLHTSPRVGCPASVDVGTGSAISTLYDWFMEYSVGIYPRMVTSQSPV